MCAWRMAEGLETTEIRAQLSYAAGGDDQPVHGGELGGVLSARRFPGDIHRVVPAPDQPVAVDVEHLAWRVAGDARRIGDREPPELLAVLRPAVDLLGLHAGQQQRGRLSRVAVGVRD